MTKLKIEKELKFLISFFSLFLIALSQQGCAFLTRVTFSAPHSEEASQEHDMVYGLQTGTIISGEYDDVQFSLNAIDISVHALNHQVETVSFGPSIIIPLPIIPWPPGIVGLFQTSNEPLSPLVLEMRLDPEGETFSFNPMKVVLETSEKRKVFPFGFEGPVYGHRYGGWPCLLKEEPGQAKNKEGSIDLFQWTCFRLKFDIVTFPLEKEGVPVSVPRIYFKRGVSWRILTAP